MEFNSEKLEELLLKLNNMFENPKYYNNTRLINYLSKCFVAKKFSRDIPNRLFSKRLTPQELTEIQMIYFLKKLNEYNENGNRLFKDFEPELYFSSMQIIKMEDYAPKNEPLNKLIFHDVRKINKFQYIVPFDYAYDIAMRMKSNLYSYDFDSQREAKIRTIGTKGTRVKEIFLNPESVTKIGEMIYRDEYISDLITLNVPLYPNNTPRIFYDEETKILEITPDYNTKSGHLTVCNTTDGWHRQNSCVYAYDKKIENGENPAELKNGYILLITLMTPENATDHFIRINTFNEISKTHLNSFGKSNQTEFVNALIKYKDTKNIFNNNVAKIYEDVFVENKLTYNKVLEDAIRLAEIDVNSISAELTEIPKIVDFTTKFIDYMCEIKYKNHKNPIKNLKENTYLLDINIFIGYIAIAHKISYDEINKTIVKLSDILITEKVEKDLKEMKINNKIYSAKEIYRYFNNLVL